MSLKEFEDNDGYRRSGRNKEYGKTFATEKMGDKGRKMWSLFWETCNSHVACIEKVLGTIFQVLTKLSWNLNLPLR
ncbi:hypothetical protein ACP70R_006851 [Stipagrostis hirtigluma subsp. patula]